MILAVCDETFSLSPAQWQTLSDKAGEVTCLSAGALTPAALASAEIILGMPPLESLLGAPFLRWLQLTSPCRRAYAQPEHYVSPAVRVTKPGGCYGVPGAEAVLETFLRLSRGGGQELHGATVALLGLGAVSTALLPLLGAFGCTVRGVRRNLLDKPRGIDELYALRDLPEALARADFVLCALPLTRETAGVLDLSRMKRGAVFCSLSEPGVFAPSALTAAAEAGLLCAAAPDCLPPREDRMFALIAEQLDRYLAGKALSDMVDFVKGY